MVKRMRILSIAAIAAALVLIFALPADAGANTGSDLPDAGSCSHIEEIIPGRAPTCIEGGLTEGKKCAACGESMATQEVIPALGHTKENCSYAYDYGMHWLVCSACGIIESSYSDHQANGASPDCCSICGAEICIPAPANTPQPMSLNIRQNNSVINAGETATASWVYTGPSAITSYSAKLYVNYADGTSVCVWSANDMAVTSCSYTPQQGKSLNLYVSINVEDGRSVSEFAGWLVKNAPATPEPMSLAIHQNSNTVNAGETATASWVYTGPLPITHFQAYLYEYFYDGTMKIAWYSNDAAAASCSYTSTKGTKLTLSILIECAGGRRIDKSVSWTVKSVSATPEPISLAISQNRNSINAGETASASWTYTGSVPIVSSHATMIEYYNDGSSATVWSSYQRDTTSCAYTPVYGNQLLLHVSITVEDGRSVYQTATWDVLGAAYHPPYAHTEEILPGTEPTCTQDGLTEGKWCPVCKEILTEQQILPMLDHLFSGLWYAARDHRHMRFCQHGCGQYTASICEFLTVNTGEAELSLCPVCGRHAGGEAMRLTDAFITDPAARRPGPFIVRMIRKPMGDESKYLAAITAVYEQYGRVMMLSDEDAPVTVHLPLPSDESFRLFFVPQGAAGEADWQQIEYTVENRYLVFTVSQLGLFLLMAG